MAAPRSAVEAWGQYLAARTAAACLQIGQVDTNLELAAAIGRIMHRLDRRHRERARKHIRLAFPELSDAEVDDLTLRSFEHFMQLIVEVLSTPQLIHQDSWPHRLELGPLGKALPILNAGRPALLVTGHLGNWEVLGYFMALVGFPMDAIARPIDNPLINDWLLGIRERRGLRIITKWNATDRMIEILQSGGSLGFIADQNAGDNGLFVPFFGKLASTYKSIGLLAIRQEVPIICGYARRLEGFRYELGAVDVIEPADWNSQPDPLYYVTARYMRAIEMMIRLAPEQYLWMHRRWKSRPRHERLNKSMPGALERSLESLPWMEGSLLNSLKEGFEQS